MAEFRSVQLGEVDSKGRNRRDDRHCFGLVRSVVIGVQRMVAACRDEGEREDAVGLLMAMALLHGSETPMRLFCGEVTLTPETRQALHAAISPVDAHAAAAAVPFRVLDWLADRKRRRVQAYTAGATDMPIACSGLAQVCAIRQR